MMRSRDLLRHPDEGTSESREGKRPRGEPRERRVTVHIEISVPPEVPFEVTSRREPEGRKAWRGIRTKDLIRARGKTRVPSVEEIGVSKAEEAEVPERPSEVPQEEPEEVGPPPVTEELPSITTELEQGGPDEASAERTLKEAVEYLRNFLRRASSDRLPDPKVLVPLAENLVRASRNRNLLLVSMTQKSEGDPLERLAKHMVDVTVLAISTSMELGYDQGSLLSLALGALLHDVGWTKLPLELFVKKEPSEEELDAIRRHPLLGYELVASFEERFPQLAKVVLQEHEREDGSGYPHGLRGEDIHDFAKVVGICDTYDTLIHIDGLHPYRAMQRLLSMRDKQFPSKLIKALLQVLSVFPLGSLVRLNTGEVARVVDVSRTHPTRPVVEILFDPQGEEVSERRRVDLAEEPIVYIADPAFEPP